MGNIVGEVVYLFAFDIAHEMRREPIRTLLGQPVQQFQVDSSKPGPRQLFFYRPQAVTLPPIERAGPHGKVSIRRAVKVLPVGAISITVRVPFSVSRLEDLVPYHDLHFSDNGGVTLNQEIRQLAELTREELRPHSIDPVDHLYDEEAYTVFCLHADSIAKGETKFSAENWLGENRRAIAAFMSQQSDIARLSEQEVHESITPHLSYYQRDLVVADWDAALVIDEPRYFDETVYIMELANLQLAELEAYDRILDNVIERSYRDLNNRFARVAVTRDLREIRIDMARLSDELVNITKFLGDWHLARIYQTIATRFHLADWHRTIDVKIRTLDGMYQLLKQDQNHRLMVVLEGTIVILFLIDILHLLMNFNK